MTIFHCPNYNRCDLVVKKLNLDKARYNYYIDNYCCCNNEAWLRCKRFRVKGTIHFCPDFVLPDTEMSIDEIIDMFDNINN